MLVCTISLDITDLPHTFLLKKGGFSIGECLAFIVATVWFRFPTCDVLCSRGSLDGWCEGLRGAYEGTVSLQMDVRREIFTGLSDCCAWQMVLRVPCSNGSLVLTVFRY